MGEELDLKNEYSSKHRKILISSWCIVQYMEVCFNIQLCNIQLYNLNTF